MNQNEKNKVTQTRKTTSKKKVASKKSNKAKKSSKTKRRILWVLLVSFLVLSLFILAGILIFNFKYGKAFSQYQLDAKQIVAESDLDTFRQSETSLVYDINGDLTSVLKGEKDVYYLNYEDIPKYASAAMIAIEDKKFMTHPGIDIKANVRAVLALIKNKGDVTQGASTITQQLARNLFLSNEVSIARKMKEIFIALELEQKYSKTQIMEFYLNNIYFANGYYGIQAASKGYFNKGVDELSLSQIAFLCAIPNNPTIYNPLNYPENTKERRDRILLQMYEDGAIDQADYETACDEQIEIEQITVSRNNYVETYVYYCAARALMKQQGFEFRNEFDSDADKEEYDASYSEMYNQCQKSLYYEGYRIYTSIDLDKQQQLQTTVDETLEDYSEKNEEGTYALQGAAVSIDNSTGRVTAIVGGRYQKTAGYTLNRGYQSFRQPGSAIKPLIVYTPSFENGYYPDDIVVDEAIKDGPTNSNGTYSGKITIRKAIEMSKNTIAWKLFEELTPSVGLSYLLQMDFAKIDDDDYYPAASLGGFTTGASPLEMTAAFATLENDGVYREPTCIIKILDSDGNEIVGENRLEKQIYDANAARMMTDTLEGVIKNGTGKGLGLDNMSSAGKTGTTSDKKDGWFVGYTPYYTTGVWVGYDTPRAMKELSGASFPGTIWNRYMNIIHKGLENIEFTPYVDNRTKDDLEEESQEETTTEDSTLEETSENTMDTIDSTIEDDPDYEEPTSDQVTSENSETEDVNSNDEQSQETSSGNEDGETWTDDTGNTSNDDVDTGWTEGDNWDTGEAGADENVTPAE
jgi:penicillin-binding protein 1A